MQRVLLRLATSAIFIAMVTIVVSNPRVAGQEKVSLIEVASSAQQWTGIAVSKEGRIFVSYPRWADNATISVAELMPDGTVKPYPDREWNTWRLSLSPKDHFVCVQSVYVDDDNYLWILDPANPKFDGVVKDGPKLLKVDLKTNQVVHKILFDESIAPVDSYLSDVRVDVRKQHAYLSDSGSGALVVVNLSTGQVRRLFGDHPSTKSEKTIIAIKGKEWRRPDGRIPQVNVNGLALDKIGRYLYYHALSGRTLYRIETKWLANPALSREQVAKKIESLGQTGVVDGMEFGLDCSIYFTAVEENAIKRMNAALTIETVIRDERLLWPSRITIGHDGFLYITTSQTHLWSHPAEPYRLFKMQLW